MGNICAPKKQGTEADASGKPQPVKQSNSDSGKKERVIVDYAPLDAYKRDEKLIRGIQKKMKGKEESQEAEPANDFERALRCFDKFDKWDFPMTEFAKLMKGHTLVYIMYAVFTKHDLFKKFNLDEANMLNFFEEIAKNYHNNPFSNESHAADTVLAFNYYIKRGLNQYLSDEHTFVCFISAMAIDLDHPGQTNDFQAERGTHLATLYNDLSILENHSSTLLFQIMRKYSILEKFPEEQRTDVRNLIMEMILATDMNDHQTISDEFVRRIQDHNEFSGKEDVHNLLQVSIKLCDFAYLSKGKRAFNFWVSAQLTELYNQGDLEKILNLTVTPGCDRDLHPNFPQHYIKLMDQIKNLLKHFSSLLTKTKFICDVLRKNLRYWQMESSSLPAEFDESSFKHINYKSFEAQYNQTQKDKPVDPDQAKVIPQDEQDKVTHRPTEEQVALESACKDELVEKFDVKNAESLQKVDYTPAIKSLVDYSPEIANDDVQKSVVALFDRIDDWNFDVFALTKMLGNHAIFLTSWVLFTKYDLLNKFNIQPDILSNFLRRVQVGYQYNPYHNAMHACDVMQITNSIMVQGDMISKMNDIDIMAGIISSMVHDYDHPGLNNAFQTHSFSYLATIYNDRSVLENHHCSQTFHIMRNHSECDIFSGMSHEQKKDARKTMVGMVISTDMTNHGKYVKNFNNRIEASANFTEKDDIRIALQIAIKMADVSNPSRPLYLYLQWTEKIIYEFFKQGDKELEMGLPVSPLMDRRNADLPKGQIAFMSYVIIPMFNSFTSVFPGMKFSLDHINENKSYWESGVTEIDHAAFDPDFNWRENGEN